MAEQEMPKFFARHSRGFSGLLVTLAVLLAVGWILAPFAIQYYLNHRVFKDMGNYTGRVDDVDLNLLRGSYVLRDLVLWRKGGNQQVPFFRVEALSIALSWEALLRGAILASVEVDEGELNFLDAENPQKRQSGLGTNWLSVLDELLPTQLHRLEIHRSTVTFQNLDVRPKVDIKAENLEAVVTNLTNVKDESGRRVATATATANLLQGAYFKADARFDPFDFDDFVFAAEMHDISLPQINDLTNSYLNIDFEDGSGEFYMEVEAVDGQLRGYAKPLFQNVNILSWRQDVEEQNDNPLQLIWEGLLGFFKTLLTNADTKTVATQIDIRGTLDKTEVSSWKAVAGIIKNAFVEALQARFEELTPLTRSDEEKRQEKKDK
jgi:hypothetical protein